MQQAMAGFFSVVDFFMSFPRAMRLDGVVVETNGKITGDRSEMFHVMFPGLLRKRDSVGLGCAESRVSWAFGQRSIIQQYRNKPSGYNTHNDPYDSRSEVRPTPIHSLIPLLLPSLPFPVHNATRPSPLCAVAMQ